METQMTISAMGPELPSMDDVFGPQGWLSKHFPGYKPRQGQLELANYVLHSLQSETHFLAEGPTGTGKSLAYGIPTALLALLRHKKVAIATANITLQEQLIQKDLPLIAEVLEKNLEGVRPLKYLLVKGMANYACMHKMEELAQLESGEPKDDWYREIRDWYHKTETGDRSELWLEYPHQIWSQVSSTSDECLRKECPHKADCFVFRARTQQADVVVTNYHMLYSDAQVKIGGGDGILPNYAHLVMDEVHEATDIAQSFCGFELKEASIHRVARRVAKSDTPTSKVRAADLGKCAREFFKDVAKMPKDKIVQKPLETPSGVAMIESLSKAGRAMADASGRLSDQKEDLLGNGRFDQAKAAGIKAAKLGNLARSILKRAVDLEHLIHGVSGKVPKGTVFYMTKKDKEPWLCCKVVEVQDFMRNHFFRNTPTVGVSATVTTDTGHAGEEFDFIADALGLSTLGFNSLMVESPFDDRNFLLVTPDDIHSPKEPEDHTDDVAMIIEDVVKGIGGKTMALFTSYRALNANKAYLRRHLPSTKIFVQGEYPKMRIIGEFKQCSEGLILATSSFWQGVDIQGQALSCVVIDKLPFATPTDPVLQYWDQQYRNRGGSAFFRYSIPKAIIALKQGAGRLIRSEEDYGAVILCDNRVITARYGDRFNSAFPPQRWQSTNIEDAVHFINKRRR